MIIKSLTTVLRRIFGKKKRPVNQARRVAGRNKIDPSKTLNHWAAGK